jgi:hypothetical protein
MKPATAAPKAKKAKKQATPLPEGDKVLAERFRTKLCRNFTESGSCPYESRCMFAHGDHQLRTTELNLQDGLTSEEAIRQFKRINLKMRSKPVVAIHIEPITVRFDQPSPAHSDGLSRTPSNDSLDDSFSPSAGSIEFVRANTYRYNPYAWCPIEAEMF